MENNNVYSICVNYLCMSDDKPRNLKLRATGLTVTLQPWQSLDFGDSSDSNPFYDLSGLDAYRAFVLERHIAGRDSLQREHFIFNINPKLSDGLYRFARGALEARVVAETGNLGRVIAAAQSLGIDHPYFPDDVVRETDARQASFHQRRQSHDVNYFLAEKATSFLLETMGGYLSLVRSDAGTDVLDLIRAAIDAGDQWAGVGLDPATSLRSFRVSSAPLPYIQFSENRRLVS